MTEKIRSLKWQFSKYTILGIVASIINIGYMWLFVDVLQQNTIIHATLITIILFFAKYYGYIYTNLLHKGMKEFFMVQVVSGILNIILNWIVIDFIGLNALIGTTIVVGILFVGRFIMFKMMGKIK